MKTLQGLFAASLLAGSMVAQAGLVTGSTVVFDLNPNDGPRSAAIQAGSDMTIGAFSLDFNSGANGDVFNWASSGNAGLGGNSSFVLSGLQFDDGSTLTGFQVLSSELTGLVITTTASSLTVTFTPASVAGASGTVFSGRYLTTAATVPEPSALALVGISLAGLALMRRRKR